MAQKLHYTCNNQVHSNEVTMNNNQNIICFKSFQATKQAQSEICRGREPLIFGFGKVAIGNDLDESGQPKSESFFKNLASIRKEMDEAKLLLEELKK